MKTNFILLLLVSIFALNSNAQQAKDEVIKEFTSNVVSYENEEVNIYSPISSFNKIAYKQAAKSIVLTKDNMAASLEEAAGYKTCIITVGVHTIVKVTDMNKKIMSGSWGCKIPYGEGYVQKGNLNKKEDYLNNIIGVPNSQRRMMYLFK